MTPVELMVKPLGRGVAVNVNDGAPPVSERAEPLLYGDPTMAGGSAPDAGLINGNGYTVTLSVAVPERPLVSDTFTTTVSLPIAVVVPLMVAEGPVLALPMLRPVGKPLAEKL